MNKKEKDINIEFCATQSSCNTCRAKCKEYSSFKTISFSSEVIEKVDGLYQMTPLSFPKEVKTIKRKNTQERTD